MCNFCFDRFDFDARVISDMPFKYTIMVQNVTGHECGHEYNFYYVYYPIQFISNANQIMNKLLCVKLSFIYTLPRINMYYLWPLSLTWFNFNPNMDK